MVIAGWCSSPPDKDASTVRLPPGHSRHRCIDRLTALRALATSMHRPSDCPPGTSGLDSSNLDLPLGHLGPRCTDVASAPGAVGRSMHPCRGGPGAPWTSASRTRAHTRGPFIASGASAAVPIGPTAADHDPAIGEDSAPTLVGQTALAGAATRGRGPWRWARTASGRWRIGAGRRRGPREDSVSSGVPFTATTNAASAAGRWRDPLVFGHSRPAGPSPRVPIYIVRWANRSASIVRARDEDHLRLLDEGSDPVPRCGRSTTKPCGSSSTLWVELHLAHERLRGRRAGRNRRRS
jgi:hypothetical protein